MFISKSSSNCTFKVEIKVITHNYAHFPSERRYLHTYLCRLNRESTQFSGENAEYSPKPANSVSTN